MQQVMQVKKLDVLAAWMYFKQHGVVLEVNSSSVLGHDFIEYDNNTLSLKLIKMSDHQITNIYLNIINNVN